MVLLGDPIETDAKGNCKDFPLSLLTIELLARIGAAHLSTSATRILNRLYGEVRCHGGLAPEAPDGGPTGRPSGHLSLLSAAPTPRARMAGSSMSPSGWR